MDDLNEIYRNFARPLYRYVLRLSRNENTAEEIVQQTFYKAVKHADKFNGECAVLTWLCEIAKNEYLNFVKKRGALNIDKLDGLSVGSRVETVAENKDAAAAAVEEIRALPEPYGQVFALRAEDELSFREIGAVFGKTENWARVTFYRARMKIIERLEERGYEM
ncbi:MAG: sigma-70 family RNA polymerase sigma factor [Lachnospiraceae bacterium]|nr:sigma-70 family RNA polymerase sigma factor [Ruminococcus sp.]MCM1274973.1 sigma-70 family RNA polymerase sigma factor [Lachnospiraceae bacterium]